MPIKSSTDKQRTRPATKKVPRSSGAMTSSRSTVSGPARSDRASAEARDLLVAKTEAAQAMATTLPHNPNKASEYGRASEEPPVGATVPVPDTSATGSTITEGVASAKVGKGAPKLGHNPGNDPLDRVRTDASGQFLTTNQGVKVADNQHSLKQGLRGPALLEDFILREKITHFDHERIPERERETDPPQV